MAIEHRGLRGSVLTTCKACGNFIGYITEAAKKKSDEDTAKRAAKRMSGETQIEGVGI